MSKQIKYNINCKESERLLSELYLVCDNIKDGIHKKYFSIYENLLHRLHQVTAFHVNIFNKEIQNFNLNDSDNEDTYDESIRNLDIDDCEVDSVSEYETDTDDDDYYKTVELMKYNDNLCKKNFEKMKDEFVIEFEVKVEV